MVKVGTQEWLDAYREALNNNPAYKEAAGPKGFPPNGWEGDFAFVIEPSGPLDHTIYQYIGLYHGECTGAKIMNEDDFVFVKPGEKAPEGKLAVEFIYSAKYENWIPILKNQLDGTKALLMGKAKLKGDMAKVMRAVKAAQELTRTAASLDTEFL